MSNATAAGAAAGAFSSLPTRRLHTNLPTTVSFPPRSPPSAVSFSAAYPPRPASERDVAAGATSRYYNAKVDAGDGDGDGDVDVDELVRRFSREVARAGILEEIRRRRRHEDARDKRKRKARAAARKYRRRRFRGPYPFQDEEEPKEGVSAATDDEENDNWELPGGGFPSYR